MAAETYGDKGQPHFDANGSTAIDVDPTQVADYAALVGNYIIGTAAQRTANVVPGPSGKAVWDGLFWLDTTDGFLYKRVSGSWAVWMTPWTDFIATTLGMTIGTSGQLLYAKFKVTNGEAQVRAGWRLGNSPVINDVTIAYPVAIASWLNDLTPIGGATFYDASSGINGRIHGEVYKTSSALRVVAVATGSVMQPLAPGTPFTWTVNDEIHVASNYPTA